MSKASNKAYYLGIEIGSHNAIRYKVFNYIERNPYCPLSEISKMLDIKEKSVSGRITELKELGIIYEMEGHDVSLYRLSLSASEINQMQQKMEKERYDKWVKLGEKNGYFDKYNSALDHLNLFFDDMVKRFNL